MTFTVTYRGADGAMCEKVLEVASRAECVDECKRQGIAPTSIQEGGHVTKRRDIVASKDGGQIWRVAILAVATLAVTGGVWWFVTRNRSDEMLPSHVDVQERIPSANAEKSGKTVSTNKPTQKIKRASLVVTNEHAVKAEPLPEWNDSFITNREMRIKFSTLVNASTNDSGVVTERYRMPNGQCWRRQIDPPPIFDNPSDNAIAMALGDRSGAPIPPYPGLYDANLDEEFVKSLLKPIAINEDDKPWLVAMKTAVKETREEIARRIKAGDTRSVGEMLREHVQENNRIADMQGNAILGYQKILRTDGEEAAAEYLEKVNEALERFGVAPIKATSNKGERK